MTRESAGAINSLPRAQWNSKIQEPVNRLQSDQVLKTVTAARKRQRGRREAMPPATTFHAY
ncbi:hypothetical protein ACLK1T_13775 [Escherichia coli]